MLSWLGNWAGVSNWPHVVDLKYTQEIYGQLHGDPFE